MSVRSGELTRKVQANINERSKSAKAVIEGERVTIQETVKMVVALKPLQGAVLLVTGTVNSLGKLVADNAEITRRWISGLTR